MPCYTILEMAELTRTASQTVAGRYELIEPLGRGGMGTIWRARHSELMSPVAVKFLDGRLLVRDPELGGRFAREARSAARVRSCHVVQIFDYGVEDETPYIVMELLEGESLRARLDAVGALAPDELERIFCQIAHALQSAHEVGVIHRDIKPQNVFLARDGTHEVVKVIDFGIAKVTQGVLDLGAETQTGVALGTPHYMSPEQARGQRDMDHRCDIWSLGVLAFEALTGRTPFPGPSLGDLLLQICTEDPPRPSSLAEVPSGFDDWFAKAVHRDPRQRFDSAKEMSDALAAALLGRQLGAATLSGPGARGAPAPRPGRGTGSRLREMRGSGVAPSPRRRWLTIPRIAVGSSAAALVIALGAGALPTLSATDRGDGGSRRASATESAALGHQVSGSPEQTPLVPSEAPAPQRDGDREREPRGAPHHYVPAPAPEQPPSSSEADAPPAARSDAERSDPHAGQPPPESQAPEPRASRPRPRAPERSDAPRPDAPRSDAPLVDPSFDPFAERL